MSPHVLVLGLPRTGTQSLADALQLLGFSPCYHMREVGINGHASHWAKLLNAKANGHSSSLQREDFESVLKDYQALADYPASLFASELLTLYPDAKVIVTHRSEDSWLTSMNSIVWPGKTSGVDTQSPMQPMRDAMARITKRGEFADDQKLFFRSYYADVKDNLTTQGREYLEFGVGTHSWRELCEFLNKAVPDMPFPHKDDVAQYKK